MNELPLPDYAAAHHRLALPVLNAEGNPISGAWGLIHFESDQEISESMITLSLLYPGTFKTAFFIFSNDQESLILIPFDQAKRIRQSADAEYMGRHAYHLQEVTYHAGILYSPAA
ncbi:hypothetical protein [Rurimicrobium arvi]|uniref:Uncharacterized protein n=1 Tax=Rurimicrobium arvi TaxID=2049916 RepID=A0ABP8MZ69_9BACT